ncbi:hypothetical protein QO259_03870 [Salinicola sp. JS01]|uniref:hypothetical protein n=1 Tax=Salinicola sp. JS01 TaxID=3050071 RepID=UPI00255C23B8|nr:hypothetical protein [Salinicola sp. JS01]WIX33810.1 hypothetical protein QO259_03870 [Salinicola sp. JS01]
MAVATPAACALLPNEPRILDAARQHALTQRYLLAHRQDVEALFLSLRRSVDEPLQRACPERRGKAYPLGQCLEISQAVIRRLATLTPAELASAPRRGLRELQNFHRAGGCIRQVWGDLRGEYFQNALLVGTLYVDVSNDTVDRQKPPVEILPFADARLMPLADYRHFQRVAARYWQGRFFPNHALPELAAYFPLLYVADDGLVQCQSTSDYMLALNAREGFRPAEDVLGDAPINARLFTALRKLLLPLIKGWPLDPGVGRAMALQCCRRARAGEPPMGRDEAVRTALKINRELSGYRIGLDR